MKRKVSIFLGIFLLILISLTLKSNAGYSSNDPVVTSGGTITITVSSSENLQNFDLKLTSYAGLTYKGCSNSSESAAVNSQTGQISYATLGAGTKILGTYTFVAPEVTAKTTYKVVFNVDGSTNTSIVTVNPQATEQTPVDNNNNNTSTTPTTPTVTEKSSVATLSNLGIRPNDFSGFKANTYSYNVEVPNETEKIEVYASPAKGQENKQKISGTGTKTLKEGVNTFEVVVTAEAGNTQKYTINVTRKAKEETEETEQPEEPEENSEEEPMEEAFGLTELNIEGLKLNPQFQTDVYEYKVELKENLEKLNITTLATKESAKIEITGNDNLQEGENIITIIVKGENEAETVAYQIIVNKTVENQEDITVQTDKDKIKKIIILSVAVGVIFIIVISVIIAKVKKSKLNNDEYIQYENINLDYDEENKNDNDFFNNDEDDDYYDEEPRKKKRSKGKRFK